MIAESLPVVLPECRTCLELEQESKVYLTHARYSTSLPPRLLSRSYACRPVDKGRGHEWDEAVTDA